MSEHITSEQAGQWVSGVMEPEAAAQFEQHVAQCPPCEVIVQREAVAEQLLVQAVSTMPVATVTSLSSRRLRTVSVVAVAVGALAAMLVALIGVGETKVSKPVQAQFTVVRASLDDDDGFMAVPRYEEGHALPSIALTAKEPFPL